MPLSDGEIGGSRTPILPPRFQLFTIRLRLPASSGPGQSSKYSNEDGHFKGG